MNKEHMGNYSGWHRDRYRDYRDEYRRDDEMYVYDQCCGNCALRGCEACPMFLDEEEARPAVIKAKEKQRKEDAVVRDGKPQWCIYWQQGHKRDGRGGCL